MKLAHIISTALIIAGSVSLMSCDSEQPTTASGSVSRKSVKVETDSNGWTVEQKNVDARLHTDNKPGAIKHLYVISPYSGQVIMYSTVKGKVTSSGKRLTPNTVSSQGGQYVGGNFKGCEVDIGGNTHYTTEVLQDDGTYGSSCEYIFWYDSKGIYHQHFFTGGQIIHVSEQPIPVKSVTLNLETQSAE